MNWRTEIQIKQGEFQIDHQDFIISFGSCFAENIQQKLRYNGFGSLTNPTGILYNSRSILKMMNLLLAKEELDENR